MTSLRVLIAPSPGALRLGEVADLFSVAQKYVAAIRRESKSVAFQ